jgi:hypothetical protein
MQPSAHSSEMGKMTVPGKNPHGYILPLTGIARISTAKMFQYLATVVAPLLGTLLAGWVGLGGALVAASVLRLAGTALFAVRERGRGDENPVRAR